MLRLRRPRRPLTLAVILTLVLAAGALATLAPSALKVGDRERQVQMLERRVARWEASAEAAAATTQAVQGETAVVLADTAGARKVANRLEREGVRLTKRTRKLQRQLDGA